MGVMKSSFGYHSALNGHFGGTLWPTLLMHQGKKLLMEWSNSPCNEVCLSKALPRTSLATQTPLKG